MRARSLPQVDPASHAGLAHRFTDLHPPLNAQQALVESQRCLYCSDAPCLDACPTQIDVPAFIAHIAQNNINGAARTIYQQNILGGSCARVCPTEILCEQACVRKDETQPIKIGLLQRYALDHATFSEHPFRRGAATGQRVAIIGAGPAGLACAHELALLGNEVDIFEAEHKPGGLNEYGVAKYKLTDDYAQKEIAFLLKIGGIRIHYRQALGTSVHLNQLLEQFDTVFLATGLAVSRQLNLDNEHSPGVLAAIDSIKELRQCDDLTQLHVPRRCIVIGAGNTAIDMAVQIRLLGAEHVSLVYRRGMESMTATDAEIELAKYHQVQLVTWAQPVNILLNQHGQVRGMQFEKTALVQNQLTAVGPRFDMEADAIYKAIGQQLTNAMAGELRIENGKIWVDDQFQTSVPRVFAGGDCIGKNQDLTVYAVQHGKLAARAMHLVMQHASVKEPRHG